MRTTRSTKDHAATFRKRAAWSFLLTAAVFLLIAAGLFLWFLFTNRLFPFPRPPRSIQHPDAARIKPRQDLLEEHVRWLSSIHPPRNFRHPSSLSRVASYIETAFRRYCPQVRFQPYQVDSREYKNVICQFPGARADTLIIGAHYDVYGDSPGADDNASGIAGLLELARLLHEQKPPLPHTLDLVAYTLEEPPYFRTQQMGSAVHARVTHERKEPIIAMISLEMIGYFRDEPNSQQFPVPLLNYFYPTTGNFIAVVGNEASASQVQAVNALLQEGSSLPVASIAAPSILTGIDFSDHRNYWAYGYPALMISDTAFYRNPHYHTSSDTPETLNFDRMAQVVKGAYWAITHLPGNRS